MRELPDPGGDLDWADPNATAYNRAATGMIDLPSEVPLTVAAVLAITSAEAVVLAEYIRWCGLDTDGGW
jgi:hypothetical protein